MKTSKFGSPETKISQIEAYCFTPNAWKSMGILKFCGLFKEGLLLLLACIHFFEFQNEAWLSLDQPNGGLAHPLLFIWPPSVLSTRLDKSVYFLLGGDCISDAEFQTS